MMDSTIIADLNSDPKREYYVYRLVDPRTYQTFYVGKGCGDRAFQHAKDVKSLISKNEDLDSLKAKLIADILAAGKEVSIIFHRRGLTEREAFEVEGALIDCYPGLVNRQTGHDSIQRGVITAEDLLASLKAEVYDEPDENYIIIKTTPGTVQVSGSLYEATRLAWSAQLNRAEKYKYVLSVINGVVREVYSVDKWYQYGLDNRIAFEGEPATGSITSLKGKRIPSYYRQKGQANPFLYKK